MRLSLKVVPKSSRGGLAGWVGDALKVRVTAAPERGKANAAVIAVLAEALGVPKAAVRIVAGETSARKTVEIDGPEADLRARLGRAEGGTSNSNSNSKSKFNSNSNCEAKLQED